MPTTKQMQDFAQQVRRDIVRMVHAVKSGHPGGSLGCNEFLTVLYQDVMDYSLNKATEEALAVSLQQETKNFIRNYLKATFDWTDLAQEWRNHQFSYNEKSEVSEKSKHSIWAKKQSESISELLEPSRKFLSQLDKLFASESFDINHISERIHAALPLCRCMHRESEYYQLRF